MIKLNMTV